ncbi:cora-like Mg2+ transporter protein-domain-containing protein [Pilobolus umbonatus]|nr:cora-like Mg2+ transporter protein-domain-containing protein [Pilobolus umbonatus]
MDIQYPYFPSHYHDTRDISFPHSDQDDTIQMPRDQDTSMNELHHAVTTDLTKACSISVGMKTNDLMKPFHSSIQSEESHASTILNSSDTVITQTVRRSLSSTNSIYKHNNQSINLDALSCFHDIKDYSYPTLNPTYYSMSEKQQYIAKIDHYGIDTQLHGNDHNDRYMYYHPDTECIQSRSFLELKQSDVTLEELLIKKNYWLDITSPSMNEMKALSKIFHIHPLTIENISTQEIREKCDVFPHYIFICYRGFLHEHREIRPMTFYSLVFKHLTLTFHYGPIPMIRHVHQRVKRIQDYVETVPHWMNYVLIDEITDSFTPIMQQIESEVDGIDDSILFHKADQSDMILRIGTCRKKVMQIVRLLGPKTEVLKALMKRVNEREERKEDCIEEEEETRIHPDIGLYLGDVQDHISTLLQNLNHYETVLARSETNYLARISIELTQTSNSTNHIIGRLTIFATILLPMNLVTGLWGMNVKVPGKDYDNLIYFFSIILGLLVFAVLSLTFARKHKLI